MKHFIFITLASLILFTGCSMSNPFGVGHERSSCEVSSGFGVCGEPKQIYIHKDKIKAVQSDYMKSGYEEELYFGINDNGDILVKEERDDRWRLYEGSSVKEKIDALIEKKHKAQTAYDNKERRISGNLSLTQDIPVTAETDLSVKYSEQGSLIETRTNVGEIIRDNGLIQKIWIAPVVDAKDDLISAHHIYLVVKEPKWIVGEDTPKQINNHDIGMIPTPISKNVLTNVSTTNEHQDNVVNYFNNNNKGGLIEEINKTSTQDLITIQEERNLINNFIKE